MAHRQAAVARLELSRQRLRTALVEGGTLGTAGTLMSDLVRRHPLACAAAALAAGAAIARLRPWRWAAQPGVWRLLLPSLAAALAGAPMHGWADVLASFLRPGAFEAGFQAAAAAAGTGAGAGEQGRSPGDMNGSMNGTTHGNSHDNPHGSAPPA